MTTLIMVVPLVWARISTALTLPDTEACTGTQRPWLSPIFCPTVTRSPFLTRGLQGAPICWDMGITTISDSGKTWISLSQAYHLFSLGWTPPKKENAILLHLFQILRNQYRNSAFTMIPHFFPLVYPVLSPLPNSSQKFFYYRYILTDKRASAGAMDRKRGCLTKVKLHK